MRRWLNRLLSFWLIVFVPSLIGWGLLVRANRAGPARFVRDWTWCADRLAFPLLLHAATDPAKVWLLHRSGLWSAAGFGILLAVWCLMLALPLSLLISWADWFGRRLHPGQSGSSTYDPYALPASTAGPSPAANVLYLVTIPLALLWHAVRFILQPALTTFVIVWLIRTSYLTLSIKWDDWIGFAQRVDALDVERRGRFGLIGNNPRFAQLWARYLKPSQDWARYFNERRIDYRHYQSHILRLHVVLKLFALNGALYGLAAGIVVGLLVGIPKIIGSLKA